MKIESIKQLVDINNPKSLAVICVLLGAAAKFGFPPDCLLAVFVLTMLLFMRICDAVRSKLLAVLAGFCFGFGYFSLGLAWINHAVLFFAPDIAPVVVIIFVACGIWGGGYVALASFIASFYRKGLHRHIAFAAAWILAEYLRAHLFTGFAWNLTASLWNNDLPMLQVLSVGGSYGLGLLTMLLIAGLASLPEATKKDLPKAVAVFALFMAVYTAGYVRIWMNPTEYTDLSLRLVQPAIPPSLSGNSELARKEFMTGLEMSLQELPADTDYIIWAETALPYRIYGRQGALAKITEALPPEAPLITGALRYKGKDIYNSALVIKEGRLATYYDKSHLVPFGEYVPLHSVFPFMEKFTAGGIDLTAGDGVKALNMGKGGKVGILICYEVIFPDDINFKNDRPRWLLNLTNDGWYGETSGPYQHFAAAKLRAIEQGLPLVRVAGTGISGLITATGEVPFSLGLNKAGVLDINLPKPLPPTLYSYTGSLPTLLLCVFILLLAPIRKIYLCRTGKNKITKM